MAFTDPLSVTYDGSAKSLPRVSVKDSSSVYRTADGEFSISIERSPLSGVEGGERVSLIMSRTVPDPTPLDGNPNRQIINSFGLTIGFDAPSREQASVDVPLLRTAVLALVDSTFQSRLIQGEL